MHMNEPDAARERWKEPLPGFICVSWPLGNGDLVKRDGKRDKARKKEVKNNDLTTSPSALFLFVMWLQMESLPLPSSICLSIQDPLSPAVHIQIYHSNRHLCCLVVFFFLPLLIRALSLDWSPVNAHESESSHHCAVWLNYTWRVFFACHSVNLSLRTLFKWYIRGYWLIFHYGSRSHLLSFGGTTLTDYWVSVMWASMLRKRVNSQRSHWCRELFIPT